MRKILILLAVAVGLSGCSEIRKAISPAYAAGFEQGAAIADANSQLDVLESWVGNEMPNFNEMSQADFKDYCEATWMLAGLVAGLENNSANKSDFIAGCMDGITKNS